MKGSSKIAIDVMIAIAISLMVNFSHLLLIFIEQEPTTPNAYGNEPPVELEGLFRMSADGHGYIIFGGADSAYVAQNRVSRYRLSDGDTISYTVARPSAGSMNPSAPRKPQRQTIQNITRRNGRIVGPYESTTPQRTVEFFYQLIYYFLLSLVIIIFATYRRGLGTRATLRRLAFVLLLAALLYFMAPLTSPRQRGMFIFNTLGRRGNIDFMIILKWSFAVIVSVLYSQIYTLLSQRQNMMLENERLRSESINAQYNMLMSQVNPHVLFNSFNSLAMLIREHDEERSLNYIDQLSYTFRYILQNRDNTLTTLREEMRFVESYIYLFKIRYADKLLFDIDIDPACMDMFIPALSLQPLLDNAVKHNTIISSRPFHVSLSAKNGVVVVSNLKYPKLEAEPSTGVGLENLRSRWQLLASRQINIIDTETEFRVELPLITPKSI